MIPAIKLGATVPVKDAGDREFTLADGPHMSGKNTIWAVLQDSNMHTGTATLDDDHVTWVLDES